jgi:8-oxo-dGTP diphosphatase
VLLLKIVRAPFTNKWAVPGGLILPTENLDQGVERHLNSKTGLKGVYSEQLYTFGEVHRDRRGRVVSVAYLSLLNDSAQKIKTTADYSDSAWFDVKKLPELAYDHKEIITRALERLRGKLSYTNIAQHLLPKQFTLTELQTIYELILSEKFDKRNFRKKILSLGILEESSKKVRGAFRPAQLYSFKSKNVKIVEIL